MDVCCVKMASRCRPSRTFPKETPQLPTLNSYHDCGSLSRVVMVRKTDQRMINHKKPESDPQLEFVTFETVQTYRGHKPDRTFIIKEKHEMAESEAQKSPRVQHFLRTNTASRELSRYPSSNNIPRSASVSRAEKTSSTVQSTRNTPERNVQDSRISRHSSPGARTRITIFTEFEKDCLRAHNMYRLNHGVPPLKLNKKLCHFAEDWAKIIAIRGTPAPRNNSPYGENIFSTWSSHSTQSFELMGAEPVEHWYSEEVNHIYGKEPLTLKTGHFSQVVWRDSQELGVGLAKNRSGQMFVVGNYDPPGNFIGSFVENVPPLLSLSDSKVSEASSTSSTGGDLSTKTNKDGVSFELFQKAMLKYHNDYRRKHKVPDLKLDQNLSWYAQEWAETLAAEDRFAHRPGSNYGENLYCLWTSDTNAKVNPREICQSWYDDIKEYNFNNEPKGSPRGGHFTQMVWKSTKLLGVGLAKTKKGKVLVVCDYDPRGNILGQFGRNVNRAR